MKNFKHLLFISISFLSLSAYAQTSKKTLNYQAVILDPKAIDIPGASITGQPLNKGNVCLRFSLLNAQGGLDYEETQQVTTDEFGLVSVAIGTGTQAQAGNSTSIYKSFESIVWNASVKSLKVSVSYDGCSSFKQVSTQVFNYTPYALYAEAVDYKNVREAPTKLSQFSNDAGYLVPKDLDPLKTDIQSNSSKIATANQNIADNKQASDAAFLVVNQSISSLDKQVAENTNSITTINTKITDQQNQISDNRNQIAATNNSLNTQIGGLQGQLNVTNSTMSNLVGTSEVVSNKSTAVNLGGANPSDQLYPSQRAAKTYIDQNISNLVAGNIPDATTLASGKIQLAGDLAGTATNPTVPALANKENTANKSLNILADGTDNTKYPSVKAVKDYVDQATLGTALAADLANKANIASPAFTGTPTAPTPASGDNSTKLATTAFVQAATAGIALQAVVDAKADKESPNLTGIPTAPTAAPNTNTTQIATTAFVQAAASAGTVDADPSTKGKIQLAGDLAGTATAPTITNSAVINKTLTGYTAAPGAITSSDNILSAIQKLDGNKAPLESPNLTGIPTAPTAAPNTNTTQIATTEYVLNSLTAGVPDADPSTKGKIQLAGDLAGTATAPTITNSAVINKTLTGYTAAPGAITSSDNILSAIQKLDGNKAPLESPTFTGTPSLPTGTTGVTQSVSDNSTKLATTAFVQAAASAGVPDADPSTKGKIQLAGDLAGTNSDASAPIISDLAISTAKLASNAVTSAKILDGEIVDADISTTAAIADSKLATISTTGKVSNSATTATDANTASAIVARDGSGNFSAGGITATSVNKLAITSPTNGSTLTIADGKTLTANNSLTFAGTDGQTMTFPSTNATIARTDAAQTFTGKQTFGATGIALSGSTSGTSTLVANAVAGTTTLTLPAVDGTLATIAGTETLTNKSLTSPNLTGIPTAPTAAPNTNTTQIATTEYVLNSLTAGVPDADPSTKGKIQLAGDLAGTNSDASAPIISDLAISTAKLASNAVTSAKILDGEIVDADISTTAAIADSKLATISTTGKVSNSATTATDANTASAIVARDGSGNFSAGGITATSVNKLAITSPTNGSTLTIADGKTLTANNSLTFAGTDGRTMTFPSTDATIARTDAAQTFTGKQTFDATGIALSGSTSGTSTLVANAVAGTTTLTLPAVDGTLATIAGTETLTNKSLTSPNLTGIPTAPTAAPNTNTTQIATTEFVTGAVVGTVSGTVNFLPKFTSSNTIGNSSITESGTDVTILSNGGRLGVGGSDLRGVLTVNALNNTAFSVNGDPGDGGRPFINQNISALNTAGLFSGITLQVSPTLGVGSGGRVLGDIRLVRSGTTSASNFVFSAFNATGAYRDYFSTGDAGTIVSGNFSAGGITATSVNKLAITSPTNGSTLTIADGKTLTANNSLTFAGTDGRTMTFPSTDATIARTDAAQTFTGKQTFDATGIALSGSTSGTSTLVANAVAGTTTLTLPAVDGTLATIAANVNSISTNYNLTSSDNGKIINVTSSSAITITIPSGLPLGFNCMVVQNGAGQVTFSGSGATVNNRTSRTKTAGQYAIVTIICLTTNVFITSGDMSN